MTTPLTVDDQRALRTRDYPAIEVPPGSTSIEVRAGEDTIAGIRGWILTFGTPGTPGAANSSYRLVGRLVLRYPQRSNVARRVEGFDAGEGGAIFLPWPFVSLALETIAPGGRSVPKDRRDAPEPTLAAATFFPVLADDPAPPGLSTVLFGRELFSLKAPIEIEVPYGATEYRVMPAGSFPIARRITVQEQTAREVWAEYTIDPNEPLASGAALGTCAWQQVPPRPQAKIVVWHSAAEMKPVTVFWRFDLGKIQ